MKLVLHFAWSLGLVAVLLGGCGEESPTEVESPGEEPTAESRALETGAAVLQDMPPIEQLNMYLDGFHFYADDMGRQVEAHHYCTMVNEEFHQCVIYDGNEEDAKLIGIEYIISERMFEELPEEEKRYWHSHGYEVKSGLLVMPGIPGEVEDEAMEKLVSTYGKTWHTWQVDRGDELPYGNPRLMMGFTEEGQIQQQHVDERDEQLDVSTEEKRQRREEIPMPDVLPGANVWEDGQTPQLTDETVEVRGLEGESEQEAE